MNPIALNGKVPYILGILTFFVQLFCNIDSYLYAQCGQFDSAWFFMCGKAMMNGMVPYRDFSDSKGVLLWVIYGIGYLYDHYSYVGVFWLACINLWGTLMISFKTARLWLEEKPALLASLLLLVPLMYWNFYTETKAEHFCWPAVAWGIYILMRFERNAECQILHFIWLGVGLISCLMLKWSVAIMLLSIVASVGWLAIRQQKLFSCLVGLLCGILISFLPFSVYFTIVDNWNDVWHEYFVNTLSSVSAPISETITAYSQEWLQMVTTKRFIYLLYTLPIFLLWKKKNWFSSALPALCGLFFIALSIRHDQFGHYISVAGPFAIITIVLFVQFCQDAHIQLKYLVYSGIVAMSYVIWGSIHYSDCFCTKAGEKFDRFMAISTSMSQVSNHPTVINIGVEKGLCLGSSLPGTKYWTTQMGRTEEMWNSQVEGINSCTADFIVDYSTDNAYVENWMTTVGYHRWEECDGIIYTKHDLPEIFDIKTYTSGDIISKKRYTAERK